jgi:hypothetical protein
LDLFGSEIKFNIDGKESFDTCLGACCTILIMGALAALALSQTLMYQTNSAIPFVSVQQQEGFFTDKNEVR